MINREAIASALYAKVSSLAGFVTHSRYLRHWNDVSSGEQPALFMSQGAQIQQRTTNQPSKWLLNFTFWIYVTNETNGVLPATTLNNLLDAVENAIEPYGQESATLGLQSVHYVKIGSIECDEGWLGSQGVAIVPITVLCH